jgi:hypothetical protein
LGLQLRRAIRHRIGKIKEEKMTSQKVSFFISYVNSDKDIALSLRDELMGIDRNRVDCFLDASSIVSGVPWNSEITAALRRADWLVCIYTGDQSQYCGYEIGVFTEANTVGGREGRLVCLHDGNPRALPAVFAPYQNREVIYPPAAPDPVFNEDEFYSNHPLASFFNDVYAYNGLYVAKDAAAIDRQRKDRLQSVKNTIQKFLETGGADVLSNTVVQLGVELDVPPAQSRTLTKIPDNALVRGTYESLKLFGVLPPVQHDRWPETSWKELREKAGNQYQPVPLWMQQLENDVVKVSGGRTTEGIEATFSDKDSRVFRTILSRLTKFKNGANKFEVLFVPTLPRQFLGKANTSMILAGLVIASRFRFAYLEEPDEVHGRFADDLPLARFSAACWQLRYDLDRFSDEAREFGLLDPSAFIKAFGDDNRAIAESMLQQSAQFKTELLEHLPIPPEFVSEEDRHKVQSAVGSYLRGMSEVNGQFLLRALEVFQKEMVHQVTHAQIAGW